jgi:hypothetical protein
MVPPLWTTEKERIDLHERSKKNIRKRTQMERARALPIAKAGLDLDKIPPDAGQPFDCRAFIRELAAVDMIVQAVESATGEPVSKHCNRRRLRLEIDWAKLEFPSVKAISPTHPWAARRRKCETVITALDTALSTLDDREGNWLAGQLRVSPHYTRAFDANLDINEFDTWLTSPPKLMRFIPDSSFLRTARYRAAQNAGDAWIKAILHKDSLAAVGKTKMASYRRTYLPQPGDDVAAIENKRQLRQLCTDELKMPLMVAQIEQSKDEVRRVLLMIKGDPDDVPLDWDGSALQLLVGERLPPIFERWFHLKVTVEQPKKVLIGSGKTQRYRHSTPYIAFATAVLAEMSVPITPAVIAKLVKAARHSTRTG